MSVEIIVGDCRERLGELPDASVHCCVTSPPYFGLRDYGTAAWEGGDESCDHRRQIVAAAPDSPGVRKSTLNCGTGHALKTTAVAQTASAIYRDTCGKCGATRTDRQMGLEPSPDEFVAGMVGVFREVRRVLRDDGTLWLNIGDSYAGSWGAQGKKPDGGLSDGQVAAHPKMLAGTGSMKRFRAGNPDKNKGNSNRDGVGRVDGVKPKDLIGIPWLLAFALRADGWYLRQDIIWSKPNPMPESVRDRCTKAHEYLFLLSKSPKYYFDQDAILEPLSSTSVERLGQNLAEQRGSERVPGKTNGSMKAVARASGEVYTAQAFGDRPQSAPRGPASNFGIFEKRNKRSVWEVTTQPFSEAHFATFPPALIEPCILAGCPEGGTVLDCFGGAGTTGLVADRLQRNAILIELNTEYAEMARRRIDRDRGGLLDAMEAA